MKKELKNEEEEEPEYKRSKEPIWLDVANKAVKVYNLGRVFVLLYPGSPSCAAATKMS